MDNLTPITREEILMNDEPLTPITREEKILAGEDLNPVTRREYFLKKYRHAGGDVMVEGLEVTANGTYTAPEGKAYSPVEVAVPLPENAYLLKTASGSFVSFDDGADLPMPSFVCDIDAVQDLHGYDAPWVGGAGKNKLNYEAWKTVEIYNGTAIWENNGVTLTATANDCYTNYSNNTYPVLARIPVSEGETITMTWETDATSERNGLVMIFPNGTPTGFVQTPAITKNLSYTVPSGVTYISFLLGIVRNGNTISYSNIMIRKSGDATFEPYSNICPISGHTGLNAWVRGKNLANPATVTTLYPTGDSGSYPNQIRNSSNARSVITEVTPNTTYTISKKAGQRFRLAFTAEEPSNGVADYGYEWNDTGTTITVTSPSNAKYMVVLFWSANVDTDTEEDMLATVQIELGETATTYEPYNPNSQTIQVSWQTEAGEVYGGYVDLVSGVLTVTRVINKLQNVDYSQEKTGFIRVAKTISNAMISNNKYDISNCFTFDYVGVIGFNGNPSKPYTFCASTNKIYAVLPYGSEDTLATINTWLDNNPTYICTTLATPQTYQLTPTQIKSLLGKNNAWCSTGDVNIDYFAKEV